MWIVKAQWNTYWENNLFFLLFFNDLDYIKENAPRSSINHEHLGDSFLKESFGSGVNKTIVIYSKSKGHIVHLIELGYKHRSGKMVPARPFMRPAYDEFSPNMLEEIQKIIERGGGNA